MARLTRRYHLPSAIRRSPVRIDAEHARRLLADGAFLIDVRRRSQDPPAPDDAVRIPPEEIPRQLETLDPERPIVLGCT